MIGTVTLNPCVDRTCRISHFTYGGMNRIISDRRDISGKGINVSLALVQNQVPTASCGLIYQEGKESFLSSLKAQGIDFQGIEVPGKVRENIKLWDTESGVTTEINQKGAFIAESDWKRFLVFFQGFVEKLDVVVLSGSVAQGIPEDCYKTLSEMAKEAHAKVFLDAEGPLLLKGMMAKPWLIKPNAYEFSLAFGSCPSSYQDLARKAKEIIDSGKAEVVCVTLGSQGALLTDGNKAFFCPPAKCEVKSTQGAGDSVVAGICKALEEKKPLEELLSSGIAMAGGTLSREGTQMCLAQDYLRFSKQLSVQEVPL